MKRAIIVRGQSGSGKTSVLMNVHSWIMSTYSPSILYDAFWTTDIFQIFTIGGIKIGFCSAGDEGADVQSFLDDCILHKCDLIIGACRGKQSTYNAVKTTLTYPSFIVNWTITYKVASHLVTSYNLQWFDEVKALLIGLN